LFVDQGFSAFLLVHHYLPSLSEFLAAEIRYVTRTDDFLSCGHIARPRRIIVVAGGDKETGSRVNGTLFGGLAVTGLYPIFADLKTKLGDSLQFVTTESDLVKALVKSDDEGDVPIVIAYNDNHDEKYLFRDANGLEIDLLSSKCLLCLCAMPGSGTGRFELVPLLSALREIYGSSPAQETDFLSNLIGTYDRYCSQAEGTPSVSFGVLSEKKLSLIDASVSQANRDLVKVEFGTNPKLFGVKVKKLTWYGKGDRFAGFYSKYQNEISAGDGYSPVHVTDPRDIDKANEGPSLFLSTDDFASVFGGGPPSPPPTNNGYLILWMNRHTEPKKKSSSEESKEELDCDPEICVSRDKACATVTCHGLGLEVCTDGDISLAVKTEKGSATVGLRSKK
jgi:hypothetical protein